MYPSLAVLPPASSASPGAMRTARAHAASTSVAAGASGVSVSAVKGAAVAERGSILITNAIASANGAAAWTGDWAGGGGGPITELLLDMGSLGPAIEAIRAANVANKVAVLICQGPV